MSVYLVYHTGMISHEKIVAGDTRAEDIVGAQEKVNETAVEKIKDELFDSYMLQRLIEDFFNDLGDYLDDEVVDEMRGLLAMHDDEDIYATLSLPAELRDKKFSEFEERVTSGADPKKLMDDFIALSKKYRFGIGYHTSPVEIKPDEKGRWSIKGTEPDHRDGDRMMAYYSRKYRHLFKKKSPRFVYIVRTEPDTHKTDGNWSRASELSIVTAVPFQDAFSFVEETAHTMTKENGGTK